MQCEWKPCAFQVDYLIAMWETVMAVEAYVGMEPPSACLCEADA